MAYRVDKQKKMVKETEGKRAGHMKVKGLIIFMLIRFSFNLYLNVLFSIIKFMRHFIECACIIEFSLIISTIEFHFMSHLVSITSYTAWWCCCLFYLTRIGGYVTSIVATFWIRMLYRHVDRVNQSTFIILEAMVTHIHTRTVVYVELMNRQ